MRGDAVLPSTHSPSTRQVFSEYITRHRGHVVDTAGDSVLATFDSPVEAVECAVEIYLTRSDRGTAARQTVTAATADQGKGQYGAALADAQKIDMNNFVWAHATLVAAYGQLGRIQEAQPSIKRILELSPNFETTAREDRWKTLRYQEPLLDRFMDGLRKAGMNIPEKKS
jgi:tetratricopeptide (TPR) repeat protein